MKPEASYFAFVEGSVPTCSHPQERRVGTGNHNPINSVPTVPTVPTGKGGKPAVSAIANRADAFEERAAIIEHDGGSLRQNAETRAAREQGFEDADDLHAAEVARWAAQIDSLAELLAPRPEVAEALRRARAFIAEGWALQAARLGWDECRLFGLCPRAPWRRLDRKGAAFGGVAQAVTAEAVIYAGGLRRYRSTVNNDGGAVPIWDLAEGVLATTDRQWTE